MFVRSMMYPYIMLRTQVSLTEEQKRRLDATSAETGFSLAELIRRAINSCYPETNDAESDIAAIRQAIGAWGGREFDGESYVESVRSGRRVQG